MKNQGTCIDYLLDAAELNDFCCRRLSLIGPRDASLSDLALFIATTERQLHLYMMQILCDAGESAQPWMDDSTLMVTAARLATIKDTLNANWRDVSSMKAGGVNSLLFYLINSLQLCLTRIEDADKVLCGSEAARARSRSLEILADNSTSSFLHETYLKTNLKGQSQQTARRQQLRYRCFRWSKRLAISCAIGGTIFLGLDKTKNLTSTENRTNGLRQCTKLCGLFFFSSMASRRIELTRLRHRIADSVSSLSMWQQKWIIVNSLLQQNSIHNSTSYSQLISEPSERNANEHKKQNSRKLLEAIPIQSNKGAFWYSQGALRLLIVRRVMDLLYASVGTAVDATGPSGCCGLWVPLSGLSAAYYAIAGSEITSHRAAAAVTEPSMDFIKRAWGMVNAPPVKWLAFEANKLLKGLKVAERIMIAGVPCLVLSHAARPSLASAIKRNQRQKKRNLNLTKIVEDVNSPSHKNLKPKAINFSNFEDYNVILHCTGGGWFVHSTGE